MSALELCHDVVPSSLVRLVFYLRISRSCFSISLHVATLNSLRMISGWIKKRKLISQNVFLYSGLIPCMKRQSFVAAEQGTRTRNHHRLTGNVSQFSTYLIRYPGILQNCSWKSSVLAFAAIGKLAVEWSRDFLLIFASRTHQLVVLAFSSFFPFRAYFESAYLEELFLFVTIPLAIEFVLDDIQQIRFLRPPLPCFAPPFVFVNHRCTYSVIRHEILSWQDLILPNSATDLYCLRAEFQIRQIGVSKHRTPHVFSVHYVLVKTMQPVARKLYDLLMNETLVHLLSLLKDHYIWFPWSSLGIQWWSQQLLYLQLRDQSPQCFP